jgi:hypothetical protein
MGNAARSFARRSIARDITHASGNPNAAFQMKPGEGELVQLLSALQVLGYVLLDGVEVTYANSGPAAPHPPPRCAVRWSALRPVRSADSVFLAAAASAGRVGVAGGPSNEPVGAAGRLLFQHPAQYFRTTIGVSVGDEIPVAKLEPILSPGRQQQSSDHATTFRGEAQARANPPGVIDRPLPVDLCHLNEAERRARRISRALHEPVAGVNELDAAAGRRRSDQDTLHHVVAEIVRGNALGALVEQVPEGALSYRDGHPEYDQRRDRELNGAHRARFFRAGAASIRSLKPKAIPV